MGGYGGVGVGGRWRRGRERLTGERCVGTWSACGRVLSRGRCAWKRAATRSPAGRRFAKPAGQDDEDADLP